MTAVEAARYFLAKATAEGEEQLTLLKLQKLLYYAQGYWLALTGGTPLFNEPILAWEHGPVVRSVWDEFRDYRGAKPIDAPGDIDIGEYGEETRDRLDEVWDVYGQFSAWKLRQMTHEEPPWKHTAIGDEISQSSLRSFFSTLVTA